MTGGRRFSQAISEGDGISLIATVRAPEEARRAEGDGAEALLVYSGLEGQLVAIRAATSLPILFFYPFLQKHFAKGVLIGSVRE